MGFECEVNLWTNIVISLSFYVLGHTRRIVPRTRKELLDENVLIISRFVVDSILIPTASYLQLYPLHIHYASSQA